MLKRFLVLTVALVAILAAPAAAQYDETPDDPSVLDNNIVQPDTGVGDGNVSNDGVTNSDDGANGANSDDGANGAAGTNVSSGSTSNSGGLARTGADNLLGLVGLGAALLVVGSAVILTMNKRRDAEAVLA